MTKPKPLEGFAAELRHYALAFPEATEDFPWGERAFKVRAKAFVFLGVDDGALSFSVKLPETAYRRWRCRSPSPRTMGSASTDG